MSSLVLRFSKEKGLGKRDYDIGGEDRVIMMWERSESVLGVKMKCN